MAKYFAGNSLAAFVRTSLSVIEDTTAGTFNSTYVPHSIAIGTSTLDSITTPPLSITGTFWTHYEMYAAHTSISSSGPVWYNNGVGVFRILRNDAAGDYTYQPQYWNGAAWTNTGSNFTLTAGLFQYDVKIDLSGSFEIWVNKVTMVSSGSGWVGHQTTVTHWQGRSESGANGGTRYSQVMIADYDLRESKYMTRTLNGNGTYTDGTGAYTDVDEVQLDDSDTIILSTVGHKRGVTKTALTVPIGFVIGALVANVRARVGVGAIADGKTGVLSVAATSLSSNRGFDIIYTPSSYIVENDPNTAAAFTESGFNAAEVYVQAA